MLLPVRKEVAEFYQPTMRQVQESQPTHFQEVTRQPPEAGELPHCCQGEETGVRASLEQGPPWDGYFIPVPVSAHDVPASGGDCS